MTDREEKLKDEIKRLKEVQGKMIVALERVSRVCYAPSRSDPFHDGWRWFYGCNEALNGINGDKEQAKKCRVTLKENW